MSTLLLIIIYITFIGLGIPDSLFGTAWPAIYTDFELPVSWANFVTLTISGGTIISSLFSAKLIRKLGTGQVTAFSTIITAMAILGFSLSQNFFFMWLMAIPLGLGAGAIDSALNNYVALHYKASHMNFLHCFYGIGVSLSPFLLSLTLSDNSNWRGGYRIVFLFQLIIAIISFATLSLWKHGKINEQNEETANNSISLLSLLKMPKLYIVGCVFIGSCAIEYTCGTWGSTFLVEAKGLPVNTAANIITFYYIGMTLGRFFSGVLANKLSGRQLVNYGQSIILVAIILLLLPLPSFFSGIALFLIGLGNGPIYPNMLHLIPVIFGEKLSQSVMGIQMALAYTGILTAPALFGLLAQHFGITLFTNYIIILYIIMIYAMTLTKKFINNR